MLTSVVTGRPPDAVALAERLEVGDGKQVHVGRVVPLVGQVRRHRHFPSERNLQPQVPAAEIGEGDDRLAPDAQHVEDDLLGAAHRLQGLRQDHAVERSGVESREAALEVALDDVDAILHAGEHVGVVDVDAVAARVARLPQVLEQHAVAAAEIQHGRVGLDPGGDRLEIGALREGDLLAAVHRRAKIPSKYARTSAW